MNFGILEHQSRWRGSCPIDTLPLDSALRCFKILQEIARFEQAFVPSHAYSLRYKEKNFWERKSIQRKEQNVLTRRIN